jgi:hypothetical protein
MIVFSDAAGAAKLRGIAVETITLPTVDPFVAPMLYTIPVQLLAYHVAVLKGTDVDQPRNLAKSVTVGHETYVLLDRTRVFRHWKRNSYGFDLDAGIVLERARETILAYNALEADMRRFLSAQRNKP